MSIDDYAVLIHAGNRDKGFWDKERNVGELLMLTTSELGEAMEAHRKSNFCNVISMKDFIDSYMVDEAIDSFDIDAYHADAFKREFEQNVKDSFEDEIADAIIRLLDMAAGLKIPIEAHIRAKVAYNRMRPRLHGKKY